MQQTQARTQIQVQTVQPPEPGVIYILGGQREAPALPAPQPAQPPVIRRTTRALAIGVLIGGLASLAIALVLFGLWQSRQETQAQAQLIASQQQLINQLLQNQAQAAGAQGVSEGDFIRGMASILLYVGLMTTAVMFMVLFLFAGTFGRPARAGEEVRNAKY